jgi:hypothetical protein
MLIKPISIYKYITFFSLNLINPLTLLIIPVLGSLIILSYSSYRLPSLSYSEGGMTSLSRKVEMEQTTGKHSTPGRQMDNINRTPVNVEALSNLKLGSIKELIEMPNIDKQNSNLKKIAMVTSLINFSISLLLWVKFDSNYIGYQFITSISSLEFIQLNLGVDGISLFFVLLTTFITPIALLSSHNDIEKNLRFYLVSILLLETLQIAVFVVLDLLLFYIFFESVLIPLFFIVGV